MTHNSLLRRGRKLLFAGMVAIGASGFAQSSSIRVFEDWNTSSGTQNDFQRTTVRSKALGGTTYYYLCGSTLNSSGNYDILVQKKNAGGSVLWSQTYNGAGNGNDYAADVQVDGIGNVYVCGTYYKNSTDSNNAIVIKYNSAGSLKWVNAYNGSGSRHDIFVAMQLSASAIVAVGSTWKDTTNKYDFLAMRLDTNGNSVWTQNWDHVNLNDGAVNLWNKGTTIYVAGGAQSATTTYKYAVVNIKFSDGSIVGSTVTGGTAFGIDQVTDIQMDKNAYIYITGSVLNTGTLYDFKTIKLDTALNILWSATYDGGSNKNDFASGLCIDTAGNVIVTGCRNSSTSAQDYATVKYSKTGVQQWVATFDGGTNALDSASAIVVRDTNQIYVTGCSFDSTSGKNYYTIKYNGAGAMQWQIAFNTWGNGSDVATAIATDSIGGIIVAGQSDVYGSRAYTTVRYVETNVITPPDTVDASNVFSFEENRGQLFNTSGNPASNIRFYNKVMWPATYFSDTAVSYVWASIDSVATSNDTIQRVDMKLIGGNASRAYAMNKQANHFSYFQGYLDNPLPVVPMYSELLYSEVYSKVDLMYTSNARGLKHYFIIKVGGNANDIEMDFNGADSIRIVNDTLMVYTKLGVLKQRRATAFEIDNNGNRVALSWQPSYSINASGNVEFINIGSYTSGRTLVFECDWGPNPSSPTTINTLEWSTFLGGSGSVFDDSWDVAANGANRSWVSGTTTASPFAGVVGPTVAQLAYHSGDDAFIASFNSIAENMWIVYLGGTLDEEGRGIAIDGQSNVYQVGNTLSTDFTAIISAGINYSHQGGASEGYFIAINSFGSAVLCDSYLGGNGGDQPRSIAAKKGTAPASMDIYIVGATSSTSNFPLQTGGGYDQTTYAGGNADAFVMRLDQSYNNVWTSYFGGSGADWFTDVALRDPNNDPVIVGYTSSSTASTNTCAVPSTVGQFPICNNGGAYYNQVYAGGQYDDCIVEFNPSNQLVWSTYFGGPGKETTAQTQDPNVAIINGNVYVVGGTNDVGSTFPLLNSANGGNFNQSFPSTGQTVFIARFNSSRQQSWTTLFGVGTMIYSLDVCGDGYNNVYFTGGLSVAGVVPSSNYCQVPTTSTNFPICNYSGLNYMETNVSPNNGLERSYIVAFNASDNLIWSTFFGTSVRTSGTGLATSLDKLFVSNTAWDFFSLVDFSTTNSFDYYLGSCPAPTGNRVNGISRFDIAQIVGIQENQPENLNGISLFPNPASNVVNLYSDRTFMADTRIQVVDMTGRVIIEQILS